MAASRSYEVEWVFQVDDVRTPEDAAIKSLKVQRDTNSIATVFRVREVSEHWKSEWIEVDLDDIHCHWCEELIKYYDVIGAWVHCDSGRIPCTGDQWADGRPAKPNTPA